MPCYPIYKELCIMHSTFLYVIFGLLIVSIIFYFFITKRKNKTGIEFDLNLINSSIRHQSWRYFTLFLLDVVIISLMIFGLSDPHLPSKVSKEGTAIFFVVQTTETMLDSDFDQNQNYTRLKKAKDCMNKIVNQLNQTDMVGLVEFQEFGTIQICPSTFENKEIISRRINNINKIKTNEYIDFANLGDALYRAGDALSMSPSNKKMIILFTDGVVREDNQSIEDAIALSRDNNIPIHVIDLGNKTEVYDKNKKFPGLLEQIFQKDETLFEKIAIETGGKHIDALKKSCIDSNDIVRSIQTSKSQQSISHWVFGIAFGFMILDILLRFGPRRIIL